MPATMTRRLQLLLDEERYERVAAEAKRQRVSVATIIRDAIDEKLEHRRRDKRAAMEAILNAEPIPVPPGDGLVEEIHRLRDERHSDLY
ncbi:ribbon-helix-helix protein, CopG family [Solicola gregarius]|uniref:Ribbon-helix-helix protein, CopG family n=1 Tax=Solicola gregarius TaxID=2908642 RepID=A0AA46YK04_9ACTN|nr:ribbon-helix-helix protein, CopG family [Solicola gregarius]UYM03523.1 ribbon-helix-helix protein, CopG family [Solicola gregarius]